MFHYFSVLQFAFLSHPNSPSWVLKDISEYGMWDPAVVVAHANVGAPDFILLGDGPDAIKNGMFSYPLVHIEISS